MKLGIIGLPQSGKKTVFEAVTKKVHTENKNESRLETISVPDERLDILNGMYQPQKKVNAQIECFLPKSYGNEENVPNLVKNCDAIIHVIRNFQVYGKENPSPLKDFQKLDIELIFSDLTSVEKKLERVAKEKSKGKKADAGEIELLKEALTMLENQIPLRKSKKIATAYELKGFAFLSAKPVLILFNNDDDNVSVPDQRKIDFSGETMMVRGKLEHEIMQMPDDQAIEFMTAFGIQDSAVTRLINKAYRLLGLISFFTVGKDEVRAWRIKKDSNALEAAGAIHSDMQKGFIRAEVLAYKDMIHAGSFAKAKKSGSVRLEAKTYSVKDGDIISFRFNV